MPWGEEPNQAEASRNHLPLLTCPSACEGLDTVFLFTSGVLGVRSIRGLLANPKATSASGGLQKLMRGSSAGALHPASGVMVSRSSPMSMSRA